MKSGLEGRNNSRRVSPLLPPHRCLNEVRPRRPEQYEDAGFIIDTNETSQ